MDIDKARQRFDGADHREQPMPPEFSRVAEADIVDVDVREDLRNGKEPFSRIMAAQQTVPAGGVLRLRAIFEPVPLYAALGRSGFEHWTRRHADDDWEIWFYRGSVAVTEPTQTQTANAKTGQSDLDTIVLDVRGLEPPEPMQRTLEQLEQMPPRTALLQINARVPQFLIPMLEERGFRYAVLLDKPGEVRGLITRIDEEN